MSARLAHELRSSLNGIKSWAHVLENELGEGDATLRRAVAGIMTGVEQQVRIIEAIEAEQAAASPSNADSEIR
jgi:signal transduction histidine kinase